MEDPGALLSPPKIAWGQSKQDVMALLDEKDFLKLGNQVSIRGLLA